MKKPQMPARQQPPDNLIQRLTGQITVVKEGIRNTKSFDVALEHSRPARLSARLLLLVGGVVYAAWHFVHVAMMPAAVDPMWERLVFLAFTVVCFGLSFHRRFGGYLVEMGHLVTLVGTIHYFSLVARNDIATPYLIGVFVVMASVSALLVNARAVIGYSASVLVLAAVVGWLDAAAPAAARLELIGGVTTIQLALAFTAWRNLNLESAARELERARDEVKRLQGLLPICMHCSRIRTDDDMWQEIQSYIESHSEAEFTHSLCKECLEKHYPA